MSSLRVGLLGASRVDVSEENQSLDPAGNVCTEFLPTGLVTRADASTFSVPSMRNSEISSEPTGTTKGTLQLL